MDDEQRINRIIIRARIFHPPPSGFSKSTLPSIKPTPSLPSPPPPPPPAHFHHETNKNQSNSIGTNQETSKVIGRGASPPEPGPSWGQAPPRRPRGARSPRASSTGRFRANQIPIKSLQICQYHEMDPSNWSKWKNSALCLSFLLPLPTPPVSLFFGNDASQGLEQSPARHLFWALATLRPLNFVEDTTGDIGQLIATREPRFINDISLENDCVRIIRPTHNAETHQSTRNWEIIDFYLNK